ncbi:MAG: hypothetical protein N3A01_06355 [Bacteroidales bacterium]|nr:hypothetical protein [Bacteroidales bacterium]
MKKIFLSLLAFNVVFFSYQSFSQCKNFAKKICKLELLPYVHDGIYNATVLSEGETAELYKTFYAGQEYRIAVCGDENLPPIQFQVLDTDRNVLYDNKKHNYAKTWDFKLQSSKQLIISIQVQTAEELTDQILSGCVAVLVGFLNVEDTLQK